MCFVGGLNSCSSLFLVLNENELLSLSDMSGLAWLTCALANVNTVVDIVDGAYMSWKIYTVIIIDGMI